MRVPAPFTFTILSSAARTATTSSGSYFNEYGYRGVRVYIDVTADPAAASVTFSIDIQDPISKDWKAFLSSAAITAVTTGPTLLEVYPGEVAVANEVLNRHIGKLFRVTATAADSDSMTYSVAGEWLT